MVRTLIPKGFLIFFVIFKINALMGELVDPLDSKSSSRDGVWVRVPLGVQGV